MSHLISLCGDREAIEQSEHWERHVERESL